MMDANKAAALARENEQLAAIEKGAPLRKAVRVKVSGPGDEAPEGLAGEIERIIGRPVAVIWSRQDAKRVNNTGEITDGKARDHGISIADYYEDAARRGARTGD